VILVSCISSSAHSKLKELGLCLRADMTGRSRKIPAEVFT